MIACLKLRSDIANQVVLQDRISEKSSFLRLHQAGNPHIVRIKSMSIMRIAGRENSSKRLCLFHSLSSYMSDVESLSGLSTYIFHGRI